MNINVKNTFMIQLCTQFTDIIFFQIGGIKMRRINRRLVLLSIVFVCDVVNVFGRPQEPSTVSSTLKGELIKIYKLRVDHNVRGV